MRTREHKLQWGVKSYSDLFKVHREDPASEAQQKKLPVKRSLNTKNDAREKKRVKLSSHNEDKLSDLKGSLKANSSLAKQNGCQSSKNQHKTRIKSDIAKKIRTGKQNVGPTHRGLKNTEESKASVNNELSSKCKPCQVEVKMIKKRKGTSVVRNLSEDKNGTHNTSSEVGKLPPEKENFSLDLLESAKNEKMRLNQNNSILIGCSGLDGEMPVNSTDTENLNSDVTSGNIEDQVTNNVNEKSQGTNVGESIPHVDKHPEEEEEPESAEALFDKLTQREGLSPLKPASNQTSPVKAAAKPSMQPALISSKQENTDVCWNSDANDDIPLPPKIDGTDKESSTTWYIAKQDPQSDKNSNKFEWSLEKVLDKFVADDEEKKLFLELDKKYAKMSGQIIEAEEKTELNEDDEDSLQYLDNGTDDRRTKSPLMPPVLIPYGDDDSSSASSPGPPDLDMPPLLEPQNDGKGLADSKNKNTVLNRRKRGSATMNFDRSTSGVGNLPFRKRHSQMGQSTDTNISLKTSPSKKQLPGTTTTTTQKKNTSQYANKAKKTAKKDKSTVLNGKFIKQESSERRKLSRINLPKSASKLIKETGDAMKRKTDFKNGVSRSSNIKSKLKDNQPNDIPVQQELEQSTRSRRISKPKWQEDFVTSSPKTKPSSKITTNRKHIQRT